MEKMTPLQWLCKCPPSVVRFFFSLLNRIVPWPPLTFFYVVCYWIVYGYCRAAISAGGIRSLGQDDVTSTIYVALVVYHVIEYRQTSICIALFKSLILF